MKLKIFILVIIMAFFQTAFSAGILIKRDISYSVKQTSGTENLLDVYYPIADGQRRDVMVFIHGDSWNSGKKETYWWLGRNMARKNVITLQSDTHSKAIFFQALLSSDLCPF